MSSVSVSAKECRDAKVLLQSKSINDKKSFMKYILINHPDKHDGISPDPQFGEVMTAGNLYFQTKLCQWDKPEQVRQATSASDIYEWMQRRRARKQTEWESSDFNDSEYYKRWKSSDSDHSDYYGQSEETRRKRQEKEHEERRKKQEQKQEAKRKQQQARRKRKEQRDSRRCFNEERRKAKLSKDSDVSRRKREKQAERVRIIQEDARKRKQQEDKRSRQRQVKLEKLRKLKQSRESKK